ncbi:MAG: hypothetical protein M3Z09_06500 [Acidobacteriota bacterium]|nr:hypothetical protein [Acidobacteriota bacterium]
MIGAILLAQWRSMRTFRTGGSPAAATVSWISGLLFYGFWAVAGFGAQAFFANPENGHLFSIVLPSGLLLMFLYWQVTPVITASMGASLDLKKLLAYPIPHGKLLLVEVLLRLTTCAEMVLVLAGVVTGLWRSPEFGGLQHLPALLGAAVLYIAFNTLLAAGLRNLLERLLLRKRMKEVLMFVLITASVLPQFLLNKKFRPSRLDSLSIPDTPFLPWSATSHLLLHSGIALALIVMAAALAIAYFFSRWQFESNLRSDGSSAKSAGAAPRTGVAGYDALFSWPARVFPDPTAAIIEKELRSLTRTPQFRLIFLLGSAFGLVLWLPHLMGKGRNTHSFMNENILTFASVYGVLVLGQVSYFNCFGLERSAAQAWYSFPVPVIRTLVAKNLAAAVFIAVEVALVTLTSIVLRLDVSPVKFIENIVVSGLAALYLMAFGNIASVRMPRAINPDKMTQSGASKAMNAVILLVFPVVMLPVGLAYWARVVFHSEPIFFALLGVAGILGAILYWMGLTSAAGAMYRRREKILTDLSRGEGPLSIT